MAYGKTTKKTAMAKGGKATKFKPCSKCTSPRTCERAGKCKLKGK